MNSLRTSITMFGGSTVDMPDVSVSSGADNLIGTLVRVKQYRQTPNRKAKEIEKSEQLLFTQSLRGDIAVMPGQAATEEVISRNKTKVLLLELIQRFATEGFSRNDEIDGKISPETADAAKLIFNTLLPSAKVPKISPDGEGGLMAVWEDPDSPVVLVVDDWKVHLVTSATTSNAQYYPNLLFDGEQVPREVIEAIPTY